MSLPETVSLGSCLASLNSGISRPFLSEDTGLPVLRSNNVSDGKIVLDDLKFWHQIDPRGANLDNIKLARNDVIVNFVNGSLKELGKSAIFQGELPECIVSTNFFILRTKTDKLSPLYLSYCLQTQTYKKWLRRIIGVSGQGSFNQQQMKQLPIPLPPLPEQIEIARILGVWDAAIGDTTQLIAAKTQHKRGLMQQLLTGERRFAEFKEQPFVSYAIGDVLQLRSRLVKWDDEATYRLASVRRNAGGLFWRESLRGDQIKVKKLHTVHSGDFLISHIQAAYGAMGCVPDSFDGGHVSDMYSILTPREGVELDIRFVDYLSQTPVMHRHILQSSNGFFAERLRLNFDPLEFLKQTLDLPPTLAEQRRIADVLDAATAEIQLLQKQLDALKTQKRGLMQLLLSGEKSVAVANAGNLNDVTRSNTEGER